LANLLSIKTSTV